MGGVVRAVKVRSGVSCYLTKKIPSSLQCLSLLALGSRWPWGSTRAGQGEMSKVRAPPPGSYGLSCSITISMNFKTFGLCRTRARAHGPQRHLGMVADTINLASGPQVWEYVEAVQEPGTCSWVGHGALDPEDAGVRVSTMTCEKDKN